MYQSLLNITITIIHTQIEAKVIQTVKELNGFCPSLINLRYLRCGSCDLGMPKWMQ